MRGIEKRPSKSGNRYRAVVRVKKDDVRHGPPRATEEEAMLDRIKLLAQIRGHVPDAQPITVGLAIRNHLQAADHRASTRAGYERVMKSLPQAFLQQPVAAPNIRTCQAVLEGIENLHARDKAAKLLGGTFKYALRQGLIPVSPMVGYQRPRMPQPEMKFPTREEIEAIRDGLVAVNPLLAEFVQLAAVSGCRRSELVGIRWEDLNKGKLSIRRGVVEVDRKLVVEEPKTRAGRRTINLGQATTEILEARRGTGYVFSHDGGETPWRGNYVTQSFGRVRDKLGLDATVHSIRHYALTTWVVGKTDFLTAARRAGHQKPSTTIDIYGRFVDSADRDVAAKFDW